MEFISELNVLLIQDLGLTQELANIACGVVVGLSLFAITLFYICFFMSLGYLFASFFKCRYYLVFTKYNGFLIERHYYFSKRRIKSIEKKYGEIVLIERFDNKDLLYLYMSQYGLNIPYYYLGKDYKTIFGNHNILYGENENEKE